jgi:PBP1b-binding outer membrane lipoprotein LpoB
MKNFKFKPLNLLYLALVAVVFVGCNTGTGVKQEYMDDYLVTIAKYKHETVWQEFDKIKLNTNDSIKCIRYKEGEEWVKKFQTIDGSNCH